MPRSRSRAKPFCRRDEKERVMDYRPLGKTGLRVSVAGLGCGGNSRLGLGRGASFDDCVAGVRAGGDLGVNFLDTAEAYGTEEIVGAAARNYDRDKLVISTKAIFRGAEETAEKVGASDKGHLQGGRRDGRNGDPQGGSGTETARSGLRRHLPFPRRQSRGL